MSNQYQAVAAVLQSAITSINAILTTPEDEMHRIRVTNGLQREIEQLLLLTGSGDLTTGQATVLGPATTIGGKPIAKQRRFTEADLTPSDDKVFQLKQDIENALVYFAPEASAEGILANVPDLVIRGVAKRAGLKVSKDEPKELTVEFVEKVKKALVDNGITGVVNDNDDDEKETPVKFEGLLQNVLKAGEGGISEVHEMSREDFNFPSEQKSEEPKQDPKPDPKKKAGK